MVLQKWTQNKNVAGIFSVIKNVIDFTRVKNPFFISQWRNCYCTVCFPCRKSEICKSETFFWKQKPSGQRMRKTVENALCKLALWDKERASKRVKLTTQNAAEWGAGSGLCSNGWSLQCSETLHYNFVSQAEVLVLD